MKLPDASREALERESQCYVVAIDPMKKVAYEAPFPATLQGYEVLGMADVTSPDLLAKIRTLVLQGIANGGPQTACTFTPRHAVAIHDDTGQYDFLICYQCGDIEVYTSHAGANSRFVHTFAGDCDVLCGILDGAGVKHLD